MIDTRNITSFIEFTRRVADSHPQIGNAYMGEVNFTEGLPDGITRCTMTVTAMADGLIKFAINTNKEPFQYECYTSNGGTPTEWSQGSSSTTSSTDITYSELKTLRDANSLIPGMRYRITDYDCVTFQENTRSAHNQFDVIVTANSTNSLDENARAVKHDFNKDHPNTNVSYVSMGYGSSHQIKVEYEQDYQDWALLFNVENEDYVWYNGYYGEGTSKIEEGYEPLNIWITDGSRVCPVTTYNSANIDIIYTNLRLQHNGETTTIDGNDYYVFDFGNTNFAEYLDGINNDGNSGYYERRKFLPEGMDLVYSATLTPASASEIFFYYNGQLVPITDFYSPALGNEVLYTYDTIENTIEPYFVEDYFADSNLDAWEIKFALDDPDYKYSWVHNGESSVLGAEFGITVRQPLRNETSNIDIHAYRFADEEYYGYWDETYVIELLSLYSKKYQLEMDFIFTLPWVIKIKDYLVAHGYEDDGTDLIFKNARLYGYRLDSGSLPDIFTPSILSYDENQYTYEHDYCYTLLNPEYFNQGGSYSLTMADVLWRFDTENEEIENLGKNVELRTLRNTAMRGGNTRKTNGNDKFDSLKVTHDEARRWKIKLPNGFTRSQTDNTPTRGLRDVSDPDYTLTDFNYMNEVLNDYVVEDTWNAREIRVEDYVHGIIYWMKDEFGNECPYDFKNIQYRRAIYYPEITGQSPVTKTQTLSDIAYEIGDQIYTHSTFKGFGNDFMYGTDTSLVYYYDNYPYDMLWLDYKYNEEFYAYTFSVLSTDNNNLQIVMDDATVVGGNNVRGNILKPYYSSYEKTYVLPENTFIAMLENNEDEVRLHCCSNKIGYNSYSNTFGNYADSNIIGNDSHCNIFMSSVEDGSWTWCNNLGSQCNYNFLGINCHNITLKDNCEENVVEGESGGISLDCSSSGNWLGQAEFIGGGYGCRYNIIGASYDVRLGDYNNENEISDWCDGVEFGANCQSNALAPGCESIVFGNACHNNSLTDDSNSFYNITFGNNCSYITFNPDVNSNNINIYFGDSCDSIEFRKACNNTRFGASCCELTFNGNLENCTFGQGVGYFYITNDNQLDIKINNWTFDNGVQLDDASAQLALPTAGNYIYTTNKRVTKASSNGNEMILAIREYTTDGTGVKQEVTKIYPLV